jgi:cytochrome c6
VKAGAVAGLAALAALLGWAAPPAAAGRPAAAGNAKTGKAVYERHCAVCHGPNGEGREAVARMYKVTMPKLSSKAVQSKSDAEIRKVIAQGYGKMRPLKGLDAAELSDLVAYIRTLAKK